MAEWKRPDNVPFPTLWKTFEGRNEINGVKQKYWIQDLTEEYYEEVLYRMSTEFVKETPLCIYTNFTEDPAAVEDYLAAWKSMIDQKLSLICLTKDDIGSTKLVAVNILGRRYKGEHRDINKIFKGKASRAAGGALYYVYSMADVFSQLNIDAYINAFGLYVLPEYRNDGIGYEVLKARREISLAVGIKVSVTGFTTVGGQKLARKLGWIDIIEHAYDDLEKFDPAFKFPGVENTESKTIALMYKRY